MTSEELRAQWEKENKGESAYKLMAEDNFRFQSQRGFRAVECVNVKYSEWLEKKICQCSDSGLNAVLADGWREINKTLPNQGERVLIYVVYSNEQRIEIARLYGDKFDDGKLVTHWQPLPLPPTVS